MAAKLAVNRTGRLTPPQRRVALIVGVGALLTFLCPLVMVIQLGALLLGGDTPVPTLGGVILTACGVLFLIFFAGLIGINAWTFLPEAFIHRPVRYARGPLQIHESSRQRPELPFSFIVGDYSFAPYIPPPELAMRPGAPYIVYYSTRSRLLLSLAALDAPDSDQWTPKF
jgi:hypothetical protein